jgi:hypothetical protein
MAKTGRNPYETTDVTPYHGDWTRRLRPPESLGARERAVFLDLVTSTDPRQFRASDLPLLCRYAELVVLAEQAAGELAACGVVIEGKPSQTWTDRWPSASHAAGGAGHVARQPCGGASPTMAAMSPRAGQSTQGIFLTVGSLRLRASRW